MSWVTSLLEKEIGALPKLSGLDSELTWPLRLVPVDDVVECETESIYELAVPTKSGEILKLTNYRIWLVEARYARSRRRAPSFDTSAVEPAALFRVETLKERIHRRCVLIGESDCRAALLPLADDGFCEAETIGELGLSQPKRGGPNRTNLDASPSSYRHDAPDRPGKRLPIRG
ncbi:hypothetical protein ACIO52_25675 [Nocardia sp. NPDC087230]|uniref:hypothetical protein n=1 Tax=Nocardia sp. NPDC087230 TaxID=3364331 RepID=UPI003821D1C1